MGTRGPGFYGGFETCVAEVAPRLADRGHEVTVYARRWSPSRAWSHPGVTVAALPSIPTKHLDTITHTAVSTVHALLSRPDVVILFGVGNAVFGPVLRLGRRAVVLNVDGLDWARAKWGGAARRYLQLAERLSPRAADVLVTDARSIERYYRDRYGVDSTYIPYGAPVGPVQATDELESRGLSPGGYVLYVSRLEPENNAEVAIEAHRMSGVELPLVIVGGAAYGGDYEARLRRLAGDDVRFLGFVFGPGYQQLQSHASVYLQCTEIGGTHPALVEAMGYSNCIIALDTAEHREVLGDAGLYYRSTEELADRLGQLVADPGWRERLAQAAATRARDHFSWDRVALAYEDACLQMARRRS